MIAKPAYEFLIIISYNDEMLIQFSLQLLFSKCLSGVWPHYEALALRCEAVADAIKANPNIDLMQF